MLPLPSRRSTLRASDADRREVAEALREHASVGRLTMDELEERLDRALGARTLGDLERLVRDLPGGRDPAPDRRTRRRPFPVGWLIALGLVVAAIVVLPATTWVLLGVSVALLAIGLLLLPVLVPVIAVVVLIAFLLSRLPQRARRSSIF